MPALPLHTMTLLPMKIAKVTLIISSVAAVPLGAMLVFTTSTAHAQGSGLCPGLTGHARTRCLQEENRRASRASAEANRRAADWNATLNGMCTGNKLGSSLAPQTGGVVGSVLGKAVYHGSQAMTYKAMGQSNPCK